MAMNEAEKADMDSDRLSVRGKAAPTNDAPVTVEQRDRDRAADHLAALGQINADFRIRTGMADSHSLVQTLARHRLAALASAPAAGSREAAMVTIRTDDSGRSKVWCDPEIADLIDALNTDALSTVASCSGHGQRPGIIMLTDGRCLMVFRDREYAKAAEAAYPLDINGVASAPAGDGVAEVRDEGPIPEARSSLIARVVRQSLRKYGHRVAESSLPECIASDVEATLRTMRDDHPALARPRAAVGEREAERIMRNALQDIGGAEPIPTDAVAFVWCRTVANDALTAILALQSPRAKVDP